MGTAIILGTEYTTVIMPDGKEWMAENLAWEGTGAWFGDAATDNGWGRFYGQSQLTTIKAAIAGTGWRLPVESMDSGEYHELSAAIVADGWSQPGFQLKAIDDGWQPPPSGATDRYGWRGLPTGYGYEYSGWVSGVGYMDAQFWCDGDIGGIQVYMSLSLQGQDVEFGNIAHTRSFPVRLVRDAPQMNLHVVHDGVWKKVSEQHQIDGGWAKSSKIFVPSSGAWAQS